MTAHIPPTSPLFAASQINQMARQAEDKLFKQAMMATSVALVAVLAFKEFREIFKDKKPREGSQGSGFCERELDRRAHRDREHER